MCLCSNKYTQLKKLDQQNLAAFFFFFLPTSHASVRTSTHALPHNDRNAKLNDELTLGVIAAARCSEIHLASCTLSSRYLSPEPLLTQTHSDCETSATAFNSGRDLLATRSARRFLFHLYVDAMPSTTSAGHPQRLERRDQLHCVEGDKMMALSAL